MKKVNKSVTSKITTKWCNIIAIDDGAALHISANAPAMNDLVFEKLVSEYNNVQKLITRLSRYYPEPLLQGLVLPTAINR